MVMQANRAHTYLGLREKEYHVSGDLKDDVTTSSEDSDSNKPPARPCQTNYILECERNVMKNKELLGELFGDELREREVAQKTECKAAAAAHAARKAEIQKERTKNLLRRLTRGAKAG